MTKTIPFKQKPKTSGTVYNETTSTDTKYVLNKCKRVVEVADACEQHGITEGQRLFSRNGNMPKQSTGKMNSPKSMCQGVIDNFNDGQYNLSDPQIKGLAEAFTVANDIIDNFDEIVFEKVSELPKLSLPTTITEQSTFGDLFGDDVEEVHVTKIYRRKK